MQNAFTTLVGVIAICVLLIIMAAWPAFGAICAYVRAYFVGSANSAMLRVTTGAPRDFKSIKM